MYMIARRFLLSVSKQQSCFFFVEEAVEKNYTNEINVPDKDKVNVKACRRVKITQSLVVNSSVQQYYLYSIWQKHCVSSIFRTMALRQPHSMREHQSSIKRHAIKSRFSPFSLETMCNLPQLSLPISTHTL